MRVGICPVGSTTHRNDRIRSLPRASLAPLTILPGIQWVWMSAHEWTDELAAAGLERGVAEGADWWDTKQVARGLDLLVSVDTAVAHLTAGLTDGPPVWLLLAAVPDMRWGIDGATTPWYARMRLYRQRVMGEWDSVIHQVTLDLAALAAGRMAWR